VEVDTTGILAGTGTVGALAASAGTSIQPGAFSGVSPGTGSSSIGSLTAARANLSEGGKLIIQATGTATPGVNYDQLNLQGTGDLIIGGASSISLDTTGLPPNTSGLLSQVVNSASGRDFGNVVALPVSVHGPNVAVQTKFNSVDLQLLSNATPSNLALTATP